MMNGHYAHARQMQRAKREQKRLKTYLGRVIRDIERKLDQQAMHPRFKRLLEIANRIHVQQRNDKNKVYSVHAHRKLNALPRERRINRMSLVSR